MRIQPRIIINQVTGEPLMTSWSGRVTSCTKTELDALIQGQGLNSDSKDYFILKFSGGAYVRWCSVSAYLRGKGWKDQLKLEAA